MSVQIVNPLDYPKWDDLVLESSNNSFFHSLGWAKVLHESYKYEPLYFASFERNRLSALLPVMGIKSIITGKRGVSLPFTDFCPPIRVLNNYLQEIIDEVIKYGNQNAWRYIELRGGAAFNFLNGICPCSNYRRHLLDLSQNKEHIFSRLRESTKRNVKKAIKSGVEVRITDSLKSIRSFYHLHCTTRKGHGLPPQPYKFFRKIYEHVFSKKMGFVVLAYHKNKIIAGAIYFHFGEKAIYKYGASAKNYLYLRPNNLVMWKAIKWYAQNGFKEIDFGRTEPWNKGLLQFKRGWGAQEKDICYYKYDFAKEEFVENNHMFKKESYNLFRKLPLPVLNLVGSLFYKHIG